jgi:hypothetical protein
MSGLPILKESVIPRVDKLRLAAQHYDCVLCGRDRQYTVPAHCNDGNVKGIGRKAPGYMLAYVCGGCHDLIDGRAGQLGRVAKREMWNEAHKLTVRIWFREGLVKVA